MPAESHNTADWEEIVACKKKKQKWMRGDERGDA